MNSIEDEWQMTRRERAIAVINASNELMDAAIAMADLSDDEIRVEAEAALKTMTKEELIKAAQTIWPWDEDLDVPTNQELQFGLLRTLRGETE